MTVPALLLEQGWFNQIGLRELKLMLQMTFKKLLIYTTFLVLLNGCGGSNSSNDNDSSAIEPGLRIGPMGDGTALVSWISPTENTDNSTLTDLAGFKIYFGIFPGEYDNSITVNNAGLSSFLVENLGAEDWFFVVTAINSSGIESSYSKEVFKTIN
jgi:hypothetical protein